MLWNCVDSINRNGKSHPRSKWHYCLGCGSGLQEKKRSEYHPSFLYSSWLWTQYGQKLQAPTLLSSLPSRILLDHKPSRCLSLFQKSGYVPPCILTPYSLAVCFLSPKAVSKPSSLLFASVRYIYDPCSCHGDQTRLSRVVWNFSHSLETYK